jgi:hypothetical protein
MPRAKKSAKVNRSAAIRDYLAEHAGAGPSEIKSALAAKGIEASDSLISAVKYKRPKRGRKRKSKRGRKPAAAKTGGGNVSVDNLVAAQALVRKVGGIDNANKALAVLKRLQG